MHTHAFSEKRHHVFFWVGLINLIYTLFEWAFGFYVSSNSLMADALHNFGDVISLWLAWWADVVGRRPATPRFTYGFRRASTLAAFVNALSLLVLCVFLGAEAFERLWHPQAIPALSVFWVALVGVVVNGVSAWFFHDACKKDLNIRAAYWHLASDALFSLMVVFGALWMFAMGGYWWVDSLMAIAIIIFVVLTSWSMLKEAWYLLLDAVPEHIVLQDVQRTLECFPEVLSVHRLHVWALGTRDVAMTAHLVVKEPLSTECLEVMREALRKIGMTHTTLQSELQPCQDISIPTH